MKKPLSLRLFVAGLCGLAPQLLPENHQQRRQQSHGKGRRTESRQKNSYQQSIGQEDIRQESTRQGNSRQKRNCHSERSEESPHFAPRATNTIVSNTALSALLLLAILFAAPILHAQSIPLTGPQQLVFTGLLGSSNSQHSAQFNAVQSDASGNLYLLLDQKDGVRLLKTDPTATNILAQAQLGAAGDIGLAMALDPSGNIYITGTTTSGTLQSTSGAAFPSPADTSTNSFIGKFDQNLNEIFLTFAGGSHIAASAIAATPDAVFLTGSIFAATLPVTPSAIIQSPASGSIQNGFVERFNATGTTLVYATYLSGQTVSGSANTAPAAIAADTSDNAYITGYTTSTGYPTIGALVPALIPASVSTPAGATTSGFLTKLTLAGDGIVFSTFIPGPGLTSIAIDPAANNLLLSGSIALGQFPVATVSTPLVNTTYQTLLRLPLDGSTVLNSTLLAPGTQSTLTPAATGATWIAATSTDPASLLPVTPLSTIGNSYALRVAQQNTAQTVIDQAIRFGGLPTTNPSFASAPVTLTSLTADPTGQPTFAGSVSPTASASLLATETYDLPLDNTPTAALPSTIRAAALLPGTCNGSLCAGTAAYLAKLNPTAAAPTLALSTDNSPNIILRNLGSTPATNLQLTATNFTLATDCPTTLLPSAECSIALTSTGTTPGNLTAQADNATPQTTTLPSTTATPDPIVFSPKELDFGIETSTSPAATRTITVTNLTQQPQSFTSAIAGNQLTVYTFAETASNCPAPGPVTTKTLAPGATCHITLAFTASSQPANDGFAQSNWTIATGAVLLTGYTQAAALSLSAPEIDFGTQYTNGPRLPRFLYISNNSAAPISHTPVTLAAPFTLTDTCPTALEPHTICQLQINYQSLQAPSADSTTLNLDEGLSVLITGTTLPPPTGTGQTVNPALTLTPTSIAFPNAVVVTATSTTTETVTIGNTGAQPFPLTLGLTGDFTDTTNCPATLPGNASCTVLITFAPSQPGTRQGLLSVTAGSNASPAFVSLTGTGTALITGNNTLSFGNVIVGQPAVQWYKITQAFTSLTASTTNPQYAAILVEDIGYGHGQPPSTAFAPTYAGTCANCWLGVQFTPSSTGSQTATLTLTSGSSGTPAPFSLTGTGIPSTGLLLTPTTQDFGPIPVNSTTAPTLFTLTNQTTAALTLTAPTITGDFALTTAPTGGPTCTGTLAPGASCFLQITFSPTATGQRSGLLTLQTTGLNAAAAPLTGFGSPDPGLALNPTALIFNNVPGPTATQQTITLTNTGSATLQIAAPTTATQNFAPSTTCTTLAPAATCTITVIFTPTSADVTDTLQIPITSSITGLSTYTVPLTGAYTTEDAGLQILPNQAQFGPTPTSTLGLTQQFTINNLTAKSLTLALSLPRQFILSNPPCAALAPNASCIFSVTFLPLTNGDITGTLFAQGTPTDGSATLNGLGYVEGYGIGTGSLVITGNLIPNDPVLNFGQVTSGQTSTQTLTLTNPGPGPITIRRITSEWPFLVTATTCGSTLSANQSCTATLTYTPLNQVATGTTLPRTNTDTGTLVVESDSLTSPDTIDLTGTAAPLLLNSPSNVAPLVSYTASESSLTFATTQIGNQSPAQTIALANTGTTTIQITSIQTSPDFTVQSDPATCTAILPGSSCLLTVTFNPQSTTPESNGAPVLPTRISAIEITSTASSALDFISLLGTAVPAALTLSPLELNFGTVQVGSTATLPLQVTNTSATAATFNGVFASGDYAVTGDCPTPGNTLAPATSCTLQVTFIPTQPGTRTGAVTIATSLSTLPIAAPLTGIGIQSHLQITPSNLNFGSIALSASANQTLTLTNTGTAPLTALTLAITGDYAITVPCTATTLAPGASCAVTVTFTPTTLGARPGTLTITSSDATSPDLVPLTGTGVTNGAFTLTVNGGPSASVTVQSEFPATYTLQLTPQANFTGTVVLNCVPITPGPYATCSLLPSSIALNGAPQTAIATINTITSVTPTTAEDLPSPFNRIFGKSTSRGIQSPYAQRKGRGTRSSDEALLCLLPTALFFFWKIRKTRTSSSKAIRPILWTVLFATTTLFLSGCGSGGDPNLRRTPPGTYQYQVTASSTTGQVITQTVTLNLTVTPQ